MRYLRLFVEKTLDLGHPCFGGFLAEPYEFVAFPISSGRKWAICGMMTMSA